jgi:DnaK suppressor protein
MQWRVKTATKPDTPAGPYRTVSGMGPARERPASSPGRSIQMAKTAPPTKSAERARPTSAPRAVDGAKLEALRQRLNEDVAVLRQSDDARTPYGGDFESLVAAAQLASQHETDELLRRRLERRLSDLERVERRLQHGEYGRCEVCGSEIPEERLAAMPDTTMCVPCQRQRERRGFTRRAA